MAAALTCKHQKASTSQANYLKLCVSIGKSMGATGQQIAGAMATMIQETDATNYTHTTDWTDSVGLYAQRPSCGWGSYAECTDPPHAIRAFYKPYLANCKKYSDVIVASYHTQNCAAEYADRPRQWLSESQRNVSLIMGGKAGDLKATSAETVQQTRTLPYEFSRGTAGKKENSWDCIGRLGSEVHWDRFMRGGRLVYASEDWLKAQSPRFAFAQGARGILSISFDSDSRRNASQMTITALANRWSVLPGDVVQVTGQGTGDGLWLVSTTSRTIWNPTTTIVLKRPAPKLDEPAPQTQTKTINVGGAKGATFGAKGGADISGAQRTPAALYAACKTMSDRNIPYSIAHRTLVAAPPDADCSSSCCWALLKAGYPLPGGASWGAWAPVSGAFSDWGVEGYGHHFTVMQTSEHIWIRFYGFPAKRFDTSPWDSGGYGPHLRFTNRPENFGHRHWPGQ